GEAERLAWLRTRRFGHSGGGAERWREKLVAQYGAERAARIEQVEALEWCEYGSVLDEAKRQALFPFLSGD
ncbi:MAG TPA: PIG-L family deacetylase, partial [Limnochordia bacterium]|nr:PIG-L family deacetylase [Limnochordia bacterium]